MQLGTYCVRFCRNHHAGADSARYLVTGERYRLAQLCGSVRWPMGFANGVFAADRQLCFRSSDGLADLSHCRGTILRSRTYQGMTIVHWIIPALWLVFIAYWAIAAIGVKRNVEATAWWKQTALRFAIAALVVVALYVPAVRRALRLAQAHAADGALMGAIGTLLVGLGLGLAVFARVYLGRNWGTPMSRKENPEWSPAARTPLFVIRSTAALSLPCSER